MSSDLRARARRLGQVGAEPFWGARDRIVALPVAVAPVAVVSTPEPADRADQLPVDAAAVERQAYAAGYAAGERAGTEEVAARARALFERLIEAAEQTTARRAEVLRNSERQLVQLAIAIAGRVLRREISLDRRVLVAMARAALERLGDTASATIRLHPDDFAAIAAAGGADEHGGVRVVADPLVPAAGCLVQSDAGLIDAGLEAQLSEVAGALLEENDLPPLEEGATGAGRVEP